MTSDARQNGGKTRYVKRVTSDTQKIQSSDWPKWHCTLWLNHKFQSFCGASDVILTGHLKRYVAHFNHMDQGYGHLVTIWPCKYKKSILPVGDRCITRSERKDSKRRKFQFCGTVHWHDAKASLSMPLHKWLNR